MAVSGQPEQRLRAIMWMMAGGLAILVGGLWYFQVVKGKEFLEQQVAQSSRSVRIPAVRGKILDKNGEPLAESKPNYNLCLYLEELSPLFRVVYSMTISNEASRVMKQFGRRLTNPERLFISRKVRYWVASNSVYRAGLLLNKNLQLDEIEFEKHYRERLATPMIISSDLTPEQLAIIQETPSIPPGIDIEVQPIRFYPRGSMASHIIGHLSRYDQPVEGEDAFFNYLMPDYKGVIGIEGIFDEYLRGKAGYKSVMVNNLGYKESESIWTPAEPGNNVVLTIDLKIQEIAEKALKSGFENIKGAVVVMNPHNGDILALVSSPSFNPNNFIPRITPQEMAYLNDPQLRPMINRASQERYAPGSVFKIITALACLNAGIDPNEKFPVQPDPTNPAHGCIYVGNRKIKDTASPGEYDMRRALVKSSNSYFIHYGLKAGLDRILEMAKRFYLGEPIGLPTGQSDRGFLPAEDWIKTQAKRGNPWTDGDTANLCIGQGYIAVNPVQVAVMISAVANGGKVYYPRLVQRIEPMEMGASLARQIEFPTRLRGQINVPPAHLEFVKRAMLDDVEDPEGTGRAAAVSGLKIAGKTGTAEVQEGITTVDKITWFASFAPFESPKYVVVVMIESGVSGGRTCAPVAAQIYRGIMNLDRQKRIRTEQIAANF
ncbi:MAG: penicillin-binding protein 2 [Verrucomicrobiia bacterium]